MTEFENKISIVFPYYNGKNCIKKTIDSIRNLLNINDIELVIIDNNANTISRELGKLFGSFNKLNVKIVKQNYNVGFAKACNIGVDNAKGKYIFITNQDIIFPNNFFEIMLKLYNKINNGRDIILSPAVIFPNKKINYFGGKIHFLGFSYTPEMYKTIPNNKLTFKTLKASGCSMFMKRKTFIDLNGFDPDFFMYHEDTDFSLRAYRKNISIYTTNETVLFHQKLNNMLNNFTYYYIERNRYLCLTKNILNLKSLIPFIIISEIMLLFHAILMKKMKIRLRIYKFLIQNFSSIKKLRLNEFNLKTQKINKNQLSFNLDPIILGTVIYKNKILRQLLKIFNLIL